jgi:hypothetical protein
LIPPRIRLFQIGFVDLPMASRRPYQNESV